MAALEQVIDSYDDAVEQILLDPRVAADRSNRDVASYLALFTSGNSYAEGTLEFWTAEGDAGRFYRPGSRGRMYESTVVSVTPESPDQATFVVCTLKSLVIVDEAGEAQSAEGGVQAGSVVAVRVDGRWKLRDLTRIEPDACPDPREQS